MSIEVATLRAVVGADIAAFQRAMVQVKAGLQSAEQAAQRTERVFDRQFGGQALTGVARLGSVLDSLQAKVAKLAGQPHAVTLQARLGQAVAEIARLQGQLRALEGRPATVEVRAEMRQAREQVAGLQRQVAQLGRETASLEPPTQRAAGGFASLAAKAGGVLVAAGVFRAVGQAIGDTVGKGMEFEATLDQIAAKAGGSSADLKRLEGVALELGRAQDLGALSAQGAAAAMDELVKAGISVSAIAGGAARQVALLNASTGGEFGLTNSALLAADAMNAFDLAVADLPKVIDTFVGSANASSISLEQMKFSMQMAAPVAALMGFSVQDTATAIAVLGQNSLKGSDAGTSLKQMMMGLIPQTEKQKALFQELGIVTASGANQFFDATGKVRSFAEIAGVLQTALAGMTQQQTISTLELMFGSDAVRAAAILYKEGADGVNEMTGQIIRQGDAARVAALANDNLKGKFASLTSTIETLQIAVGTKLNPELGRTADGLNRLASSPGITSWAEGVGLSLAVITSAFGGLADEMATKFGAGTDKIREKNALVVQEITNRLREAGVTIAGFPISSFWVEMWLRAGNETHPVVVELTRQIESTLVDGTRGAFGMARGAAVDELDILRHSATEIGQQIGEIGGLTGRDYIAQLTSGLWAGAPGLDNFWAELEVLFDQRAFMANIGRANARAYAHNLLTQLHLDIGDTFKTGIFRDPELDKLLQRNLPALIQDDIRGRRMAGGAGNAAIQAERAWEEARERAEAAARGGRGRSGGGGGRRTIDAITAATDQTKAVAGAIQEGIAALGKLGALQIPANLGAQIDAFAGATNLIMQKLGAVALQQKAKGLSATMLFADASQKVYGSLSAGVDFYGKLTEALGRGVQFGGQTQAQARLLAESVIATTVHFGRLVPPWKEEQVARTGQFAEATGKVLGAMGAGVDFYGKLHEALGRGVTFSGGVQEQSRVLAAQVVDTTVTFGRLVPPWKEEQVAATSTFAEATGKVLGAVSAGVDYYSKLHDALQRGVTFSGGVQEQTRLLAAQVVDTTVTFGRLVPPWKDEQVAQTGAFAEATGKVLAAVGAGVDFFAKLYEVGQRGVVFSRAQVEQAGALAADTIAITRTWGELVPPWKTEMVQHAGAVAEASGKILGSLTAGWELLAKIAEATARGRSYSSQGVEEARLLAGDLLAVARHFAALAPAWSQAQAGPISLVAETSGKVASTLGGAFDLFAKIDAHLVAGRTYSSRWVGVVGNLSHDLLLVSSHFQALAPEWDALARERVGNFAESTQKIAGGLGSGFDLFARIDAYLATGRGYSSRWTGTVQDLSGDLFLVASLFKGLVPRWDELAHRDVGAFAGSTQQIVGTLGATFDLAAKITNYLADGRRYASDWVPLSQGLVYDLLLVATSFKNLTPAWDEATRSAVSGYATTLGEIVQALTGGLGLLEKLADPELVLAPTASVDVFVGRVSDLVARLAAAAPAWDGQATRANADLAETAGRMVAGAGAAIKPLADLATFTPPSDAAIDAFFGNLSHFLDRFQDRAAVWSTTATKGNAELAGYVGQVVAGAGSAVRPLADLAGLKELPGPEAVDAYFARLDLLVTTFAARAATWKGNLTEETVKLAQGVQTVMGGVGSAVDALKKIGDLGKEGFDPAAIDFAIGNISLALQKARDLGGVLPADQLAAAAAAAGQYSALFGSLKAALDSLAALGGGAGPDPAAVTARLEGLAGVLAALPATVQTQATAGWESLASDWREKMGAVFTATEAVITARKPAAVTAAYDYGAAIGDAVRRGLDAQLAEVRRSAGALAAAAQVAAPGPPPPEPAPPPGPGPQGAGGARGYSAGQVVTQSGVFINGTLVAQVPQAGHYFLVGAARARALQNPGAVGPL